MTRRAFRRRTILAVLAITGLAGSVPTTANAERRRSVEPTADVAFVAAAVATGLPVPLLVGIGTAARMATTSWAQR